MEKNADLKYNLDLSIKRVKNASFHVNDTAYNDLSRAFTRDDLWA